MRKVVLGKAPVKLRCIPPCFALVTPIVVIALSATQPALAISSFVALGDLPGGQVESLAFGVSGDGSVVVGQSHSLSGQNDGFRWTAASGMEGLGDNASEFTSNSAEATSNNGSVVVGLGFTNEFGGINSTAKPARWTVGASLEPLGDLPGGGASGVAFGVSAAGSVIVGRSASAAGEEAFRWTSAEGMMGLGFLPGGTGSSQASLAHDVSGDGSVVVGWSPSISSPREAFRWTEGGGMVGLGNLPGGSFSRAWGVSADGLVVVGESVSESSGQAFRWTESEGMVDLGSLMGTPLSTTAFATSGDGSKVVGVSFLPASDNQVTPEAFYWDATHGMRSLREILIAQGIDLTGWTLESAQDISLDGLTIVGYGTNPSGFTEAWIATIPEPSTALLLGIGLVGLAARRRV